MCQVLSTGSHCCTDSLHGGWSQLSTGKMEKQCDVCKNYYEVCPTCKKYGQLKGCVEDKKSGWHDNGGYVPDPDEKKQNTGSWLKKK